MTRRALAAVAVAVCAMLHPAPAWPAPADGAGPVRAQIKASRQTVIAAAMSGTLTSLAAREGEVVAKGTLIAAIDCATQRAIRRISEAKLETARVKARVNAELERHNAVSLLEVEVAKAEMSMARAELEAADAAIGRCEIRAPFDAVVVARAANPHQFIREGEPLYELVDRSSLEIEMIVPARWLVWLRPGARFSLDMEETGQRREGEIDRLGGRVDPVSQTVRALGRFSDGGEGLLPGMSGLVGFSRTDTAGH